MSSKGHRPLSPPADVSEGNSAGASRRRLIQAMGLIGASGLVSIDWQKPRISIGGLTAHAQASENCSAVLLEFGCTKAGTGSMLIFESRSDGVSTLTEFSFLDSFYASILGTGVSETVTFSGEATWSPTADVIGYLTANCCTNLSNLTASGSYASETSINFQAALPFEDDGACSPIQAEVVEGGSTVAVTTRRR